MLTLIWNMLRSVEFEVERNSESLRGLADEGGMVWPRVTKSGCSVSQWVLSIANHWLKRGKKRILWDICDANVAAKEIHSSALLMWNTSLTDSHSWCPFHPYCCLTEAIVHPGSSQPSTEPSGATKPGPFLQHRGHLQCDFESIIPHWPD